MSSSASVEHPSNSIRANNCSRQKPNIGRMSYSLASTRMPLRRTQNLERELHLEIILGQICLKIGAKLQPAPCWTSSAQGPSAHHPNHWLHSPHGEQSCACASPHERRKHVAFMCVPSQTRPNLANSRPSANRNILVTPCYNQLASASKKPFGETSASGYHGRIPLSPSRRSTECLGKGGIRMFCDTSQTTRRWKDICSCLMPHDKIIAFHLSHPVQPPVPLAKWHGAPWR